MKVIIRDDDTCYYTQVSELEYCYKQYYDELPICLSVTPFRVAGKYFANADDPTKEIPLHMNPELIDYLKDSQSRNRYQIALHGYSHIYYNDINHSERTPEYATNEDFMNKTAVAKRYIEDKLDCRLDTFIPPSNQISKTGVQAIANNGLNLMNFPGFLPRRRPFEVSSLPKLLWIKLFKIMLGRKIYPFPIKFNKHIELESFLLYPNSNLGHLLNQMNWVNKVNGVFVLATHYHAFDKKINSGETIKSAFEKLIDHAKRLNAEFITYEDLWKNMK